MPFGLKNAPAFFQRLMETAMAGLLWVVLVCYIDDLIIFGRSFDDHLANVGLFLQRCSDRCLRLNAAKCRFFCVELPALGHILSGTGIRPPAR